MSVARGGRFISGDSVQTAFAFRNDFCLAPDHRRNNCVILLFFFLPSFLMNIDPSLVLSQFYFSYLIFISSPFSYLFIISWNSVSFFRTVSQISSIASYLAEESLALERKLDSSDPWLPWVFFLGWTSFQGGKDSPRTSELDPIFTFSTFCCHPIRWQGERWSCVAWNDSLATLPRLCIPWKPRSESKDEDPSFQFLLFI